MTKLKMKRRSKLSPACFCLIFSSIWGFIYISTSISFGQVNPRCLTPQYDSLLKVNNPLLHLHRNKLNELIEQTRLKRTNAANLRMSETEPTLIIPVVIHVVHNTKSGFIGGPNNTNISDEQIFSQIEVLNEDYRRKEGTPGFNSDPAGADVNIEFRLATLDPNGNPSIGITRTYTEQSAFDINTDDSKLKSLSYWPSNRYLNIWVTTLKNKYLGYAQFPDVNNVAGLPLVSGIDKTDGVVINHTNFGRQTGTVVSGVYGNGRTTTHEVAHWLGLLHTWGDDTCGEDYCADTPAAEAANNTVTCTEMFSACTGESSRNMIENFLDYSPDKCMNVFTQDQKNRIRQVLEVSPRRAELVRRSAEVFRKEVISTEIRPNPANEFATILLVEDGALVDNPHIMSLEVINAMGRSIHTLSYRTTGDRIILDVRMLPAGMYFIRLKTDKETRTAKLLVTNKS